MKTMDLEKYVADLQLSTSGAAYPARKSAGSLVTPNEEQSFLNDKSLVSFASGVSGQRRKDVLNSVLLAQLAANKQFPDDANILEWYKTFVKILNNLGWTIQAAEFSTFQASADVFEVENAIIDILTKAFGGAFKTAITSTLDAIKSLSDHDGKITAFEKNTHSLSKGAFQIALATEKDETVALQIGTFLLTSSNEIKKILFFKSSKDKTKLEYCSREGTLVEEIYATVRSTITDKLGDKINQFVAEIEI